MISEDSLSFIPLKQSEISLVRGQVQYYAPQSAIPPIREKAFWVFDPRGPQSSTINQWVELHGLGVDYAVLHQLDTIVAYRFCRLLST